MDTPMFTKLRDMIKNFSISTISSDLLKDGMEIYTFYSVDPPEINPLDICLIVYSSYLSLSFSILYIVPTIFFLMRFNANKTLIFFIGLMNFISVLTLVGLNIVLAPMTEFNRVELVLYYLSLCLPLLCVVNFAKNLYNDNLFQDIFRILKE